MTNPGHAGPFPWLEVWVEAGREGQVFTYASPPAGVSGGPAAAVGDLVQVRLQGRLHSGLVVGCLDRLPAGLAGKTIRPIEAVLQRGAIEPRWRGLMEEVANRCHTSLFRTLKSALPPGWLGRRSRAAPGSGRLLWQVVCTAAGNGPVKQAGGSRPLTGRQQHLLEQLGRHGGRMLLRDLVSGTGISTAVVTALERKGLVRREAIREPLPAGGLPIPSGRPAAERRATAAQARAVEAITRAPQGQALLLWGVTGSGKTEVYLQAAASELGNGRSVLILAPEIGLIPQLLDRCRVRFGAAVIEYHSGMGAAERVATWRQCLQAAERGAPRLAVGTRSAVFLPLGRLGLIVLDEEHDGSYKQESPMPCYHARDVARLRASHCGARLVLGSATPSLESWLSCGPDSGDTRLLRLPERIGRQALPRVRVVDMRRELAEGHRQLISRALMGRLQQLQAKREQAVLLVPRRGYRAFLGCRSCGEAVLCPHCDVTLTVHRHADGREWLRCHWCDHRQEVARRCAHCGSTAFRPFGAGTQRVMEQLGDELQGLRLLRFDQDTTRGRDGHRRLLEQFAAGEADVLVGTQMLAKGMDLPRVTLAAVLAADGLLHRPDLRSSEHCLQLLLQLAGRAGRGELPGEVLVQTYCPEHPVIRHLVDGRYEKFLEEELALRRHGGLVPFRRACLLRLAGPSASATATAATVLVEHIRAEVEQAGWCLIGPAPAPVARVAGRSRWQVLLHGPPPQPSGGAPAVPRMPLPPESQLQRLLPGDVSLAIDPDPLQL